MLDRKADVLNSEHAFLLFHLLSFKAVIGFTFVLRLWCYSLTWHSRVFHAQMLSNRQYFGLQILNVNSTVHCWKVSNVRQFFVGCLIEYHFYFIYLVFIEDYFSVMEPKLATQRWFVAKNLYQEKVFLHVPCRIFALVNQRFVENRLPLSFRSINSSVINN